MGFFAQSHENIADKILVLYGLPEPVGFGIIRMFQLERPGIGHLYPLVIDNAHIFEYGSVFLAEHPEALGQEFIIRKLLQREYGT